MERIAQRNSEIKAENYGNSRRDYLREHKPRLWAVLVNNGTLADHLKGIVVGLNLYQLEEN